MDNEKRSEGYMKGFSIVLIGFLLAGFLMPAVSAQAAVTASRDLPASADAGDSISVSLDLTVTEIVSGIIVKEYVPSGWTLTDSDPSSDAFNADTGEIKWVLFDKDGVPSQTITYDVTIPDTETTGDKTFSGQVLYAFGGDQTDDISGDTSISVSGVTPTAPVVASRDLPASADAGDSISVSLDITVSEIITGIIMKDYVPSGWTITDSDPEYDAFNADTGEVKWVLFDKDGVPSQSITYTVSIPASESEGVKSFSGQALYNLNETQYTEDTIGDTTIDVAGAPAPITVTRDIASIDAGSCGSVKLTVASLGDPGITGLIVKEYIPDDWNVTDASPEYDSYTEATGEIKWVLFDKDGVPSQTITYTVCLPDDATGDETFTGQFLYNDAEGTPVTEVTGGDTEVPAEEEARRRRRRYMDITVTGNATGEVMTITAVDRNTGDLLEDVDVDIYLNGVKVFSELTDEDGKVEFTPTEPGTYTITADMSRYRDEELQWVITGEAVTTVPVTTVPETTVTETTVTETTVPTTAPTTVPTTAPTTVPTTAPTTVPTTVPTTTVPAKPAPPVPMWLIVLIVLIVIVVIIYFVTKGGKGAKAEKAEEKPEEEKPEEEKPEEKKANNKKKAE